jgi:ketosteroid isomerase-like protein
MRRSRFLLLLILFILLACASSEEEKIVQVLKTREASFQKKDLALYLSCISQAYQDKDEDFVRLKRRIEGYFKTFDKIDYHSWDRTVEVQGESAVAVQQFNLEVEKGGKKNQFSDKESIILRKEGKGWKIISGL